MGLIRKTFAVASAIAAPASSRSGQPGFIKYRSEAEEARREQTALLREQTELLRRQTQAASEPTTAMGFFCKNCINDGCYVSGPLRVVDNAKLCDCLAHHT